MVNKKKAQSMLFPEPENIDDSVQIELNQKTNYSITKAMLEELSYGGLYRVFYGMHNISMHHQMLTSLNPHEILAIFMGVHDIKYEKQDLHENLAFSEPEDVYDIINEVNKCAYTDSDLLSLKIRKKYSRKNVHKQTKGDLEKRIKKLQYYPKWRFLMSFRMPKKEPMKDFYDPNCDDRGARAKNVYVNRIFNAINKIYEKNKKLVESPGYAARTKPLTREEILEQTTLEYIKDVEGCQEDGAPAIKEPAESEV